MEQDELNGVGHGKAGYRMEYGEGWQTLKTRKIIRKPITTEASYIYQYSLMKKILNNLFYNEVTMPLLDTRENKI